MNGDKSAKENHQLANTRHFTAWANSSGVTWAGRSGASADGQSRQNVVMKRTDNTTEIQIDG